MVAVINYNMGNLASVMNALAKIDVKAKIESDPDKLKDYDKLILPGVGAFADAMEHLRETSLDEAIKDFVKTGKDILGICLGMQLLFDKSYEHGEYKGLGLITGEVVKFETKLKVPHMGWNKVFVKDNKLFKNLNDIYLYFVHSYYVKCDDSFIIGKTIYDYEFTSAVNKDNIYGLQPHPEKSHNQGLQILKNFIG